jgi:hypothetical protein
MSSAHHEAFAVEGEIAIGSDRSFCFVFAGVFAVVALWPLWRSAPVRTWALAVSAGFLLIGLVAPGVMHGANVLWMKFAALLSRFTNPIITGLMFFVIFTPVGWLMRLAGRDPLRLRLDPRAKSYWIPREPPGPDPATLPRQY